MKSCVKAVASREERFLRLWEEILYAFWSCEELRINSYKPVKDERSVIYAMEYHQHKPKRNTFAPTHSVITPASDVAFFLVSFDFFRSCAAACEPLISQ